jgi:ribosomal protein S18 acetylase RimI-like enzyme
VIQAVAAPALGPVSLPCGLPGDDIRLRPALGADLAFKRQLYADGRSEELAHLGWTNMQKAMFLAQQFALQQRHIDDHHRAADLLIIEDVSGPRPAAIGRIDLDRTASPWRLIEIALSPSWRSRGLGGRLIRWLQDAARAAGSAIDLHVVADNDGARRFYLRHGFRDMPSLTRSHWRLIWDARS